MAKFVLLDTETTGAGDADRIIQIGFMVLEAGKEVEVYNEFCSTEVPIAYAAMEVHHITPADGGVCFAQRAEPPRELHGHPQCPV